MKYQRINTEGEPTMKFLELTRKHPFEGYSVLFINPIHIETIFRMRDMGHGEFTRVQMHGEDHYDVIETPNQILDQLEKLPNV